MNHLAKYASLFSAIFVAFCKASGTCNSPDADVLILGAGFSGVAAAKTLFDAKITDFLVLEARDEIGGRVRSMKFAGITVEVGANWIHGVRNETTNGTDNKPTNPLWTLKLRCNLKGVFTKLAWEPGPLKVYDMNGNNITNNRTELRYGDIEEAADKIGANITSQQRDGIPDRSIRSALMNAGWNPTTPADNFLDFMNFNFGHANTPENLSLYQTLQGDNTSNFGEDNFYVTDERGYAYLARCMGDAFKLTEKLSLNTTITTIDHNSTCVCATSENGTKFCGKYAIVTFSIGVLQGNYVKFSPELPKSKSEAINLIRNGLFLRIYLEFNETFWDDDSNLVFIGRATQDIGDYAVFQPVGQYYPSKPHILLAIITSERALQVANQNINITKKQIMDALRTIYPNFKAELLNISVPDWGSNPLYNGAFSLL